jgi:hypothetical protein
MRTGDPARPAWHGDEPRMLDYLLDRLPEPEREDFERRYFAEEPLFEQITSFEDELIDRFLASALSEEDHRQFTARYMRIPHLRKKVEFARALKGAAKSVAAATSSRRVVSRRSWGDFLQFGSRFNLGVAITVALVASVGLAWMISANGQLETRLRAANEELSRQRVLAQRLSAELNKRESGRSMETAKPLTVAFVLLPGAVRDSGESTRLLISRQVELVKLTIELARAAEYKTCRAVLRTAEMEQVWSENVRPDIRALELNLPARLIPSGDYILSVEGTTPGGEVEAQPSYTFRVVRR